MSRSVEDDWVLDEAEALLDMDGRRERLELVVATLRSGRIQPVGHATARERIEKRIRDRRTLRRGLSSRGLSRSCKRWTRSMT